MSAGAMVMDGDLFDNSSEQLEFEGVEGGWIQWFCALDGNEFFVEIEEQYLKDSFNLLGLKLKFDPEKYRECLDLISSQYMPTEQDLQDESFLELNQEASDLYGLIHSRFILTPRGMALMYQKFISGHFGICPRVLCEKQIMLPIGMSDEPRTSRVKVFCPKCEEVYIPKEKSISIDGSFFGTSFPHIFLKSYHELIPPRKMQPFVPKIYGFKLYRKSGSKFKGKPPLFDSDTDECENEPST